MSDIMNTGDISDSDDSNVENQSLSSNINSSRTREGDIDTSIDINDNYEPCYTKDQLDKINKFFQLKGKYDEIVRRKKQKIINQDKLSKREKKRLWDSQKIKCINCKKPVGTFFSVKNRRLLAICGASKNTGDQNIQPCKLNIDIQLANITTMQETINSYAKYKEEDKESIIKTKLDLLFNFTNEEEAITEFEKKRDEFDADVATYNNYLELFMDIHDSKEKRESLKILLLKKESLIKEIKTILKPDESDSDNVKPSRIVEALDIQISDLNDVLSQIKNLKYEYYKVVEDDENPLIHKLDTKTIITERSEIIIDNECVINKFVM
tara:strand:+ start:16920 stop:17891 length:972 start_codon:yes stop_codon:yes gene_type:complete